MRCEKVHFCTAKKSTAMQNEPSRISSTFFDVTQDCDIIATCTFRAAKALLLKHKQNARKSGTWERH
ncbi:MAG: hypothetical protein NVSMB27_06820 [Ktedonobacteraceae bacterium]